MGVRPSRLAGILVGCAALAGAIGVPAAAQPTNEHGIRVTITGNIPSWATTHAKISDANKASQREVRIALRLRQAAQAEQLAKEISTPGSPRFRKPLTAAEFADRFAPSRQDVDQVSAWLRDQGLAVTSIAENHHFVTARGSVAQLEAAFATHLAVYRVAGRALTAPQHDVSVPATVCRCITAVLGLDDQERTLSSARIVRPPLASHQPGRRPGVASPPTVAAAAPGKFCSRFWGEVNNVDVPQKYPAGQQGNQVCGYTVAQTRGIYGLTAAHTGAGQTVALTGNFNSANTVADVNRWASQSGTPALTASQYETVLPPGGGDPNPACDREPWVSEQAMDVEAVHAIAPAAKIIWYSAEGCSALPALNTAVAQNRASIISNSWSLSAGENGVTPAFRDQLEAITVQAAIQGQAILFSSGDHGDNSRGSGQVNPIFPASNPWVTAVGGTTVGVDGNGRVAFQAGWTAAGNTLVGSTWVPQADADGPFAGGAGGGVSKLYDAPDYQSNVPTQIAQGKRAFPDVAALADGYTGMAIGFTSSTQGFVLTPGGGTSLASPLLAGLVANAQQAHRADRFGFLNPALYGLRSNRSAITDVTPQRIGIWTPAMGAPGGVVVPPGPGDYLIDVDTKPQTLQTATGWDPLTGIGTPAAGFAAALG